MEGLEWSLAMTQMENLLRNTTIITCKNILAKEEDALIVEP